MVLVGELGTAIQRINSYIVGCKLIYQEDCFQQEYRINSYIVGCKCR